MNEQDVGQNIRKLRLASEATLDEIAKRAGLTKSTLSKIETGQTSSPISTLLAVSNALGVHLSEFFREEQKPASHVLTRKGQGRQIVRDGTRLGYAYEALAVDFPNKPLEPFLLTISPGDAEGQFQHKGQEFIYLLAGEIAFTLGEEKFTIEAGDSLYFDSSLPHSLKLIGKTPARFLCCFIEAA